MQTAHKIVQFQHNPLTLATATSSYKDNVIKICNYVSAVVATNLPTLSHPFEDWDKFEKKYISAKTDALNWTNNVLSNLLETPKDILEMNSAVQIGFTDIINYADDLIKDPGDLMTRQALKVELNKLLKIIASNENEVLDLIQRINKFASDLPQQAKNLEALADQATKQEGVDQDKVKELSDAIDSLQSEIDSLVAEIVALGIADAACIAMGVAAVCIAGPWGLVTWPFLGIGIAVATTVIVLDGVKIKNDMDKIKSKQNEVNEYTQDATLLKKCADTFKKLSKQATAIQANIKEIVQEWFKLEKSIQMVIDELEQAESDMKSEDWTHVKKEFTTALKDWNKMIDSVGPLNINIQGNDAQIKAGMSQAEVKSAYDQGTNMDFVEYIRKIS